MKSPPASSPGAPRGSTTDDANRSSSFQIWSVRFGHVAAKGPAKPCATPCGLRAELPHLLRVLLFKIPPRRPPLTPTPVPPYPRSPNPARSFPAAVPRNSFLLFLSFCHPFLARLRVAGPCEGPGEPCQPRATSPVPSPCVSASVPP